MLMVRAAQAATDFYDAIGAVNRPENAHWTYMYIYSLVTQVAEICGNAGDCVFLYHLYI